MWSDFIVYRSRATYTSQWLAVLDQHGNVLVIVKKEELGGLEVVTTDDYRLLRSG